NQDLEVVRVYFHSRAELQEIASENEPWEIQREQGFVVLDVTADERARLEERGFRVEVDLEKTAEIRRPHLRLPGQETGIAGFPCYRTVEETYASASALASAHPNLASWIDIGDSWLKTQNQSTGYDMMLLKLTSSAIQDPNKPKLYVQSSIHAREYAPAELNTRFAEYLVSNYGVDPDVTWMLDYHEVHLLLQGNPDARKEAEAGKLWRKNKNNNFCSNTDSRGVDLNRNYDFLWN